MSRRSRPRVIIAGIGTESSSFAPHRTTLRDFGVRDGERVLERFPAIARGALDEVEFVPGPVARSLPGGAVTRPAYDALVDRVLHSVRQGAPWDGVLLDIHGAMLVDGLDDAEADLARRVRQAAGGAPVVMSAAMDLHGNVSRDFVAQVDLPTCYRTAPHIDECDTRDRAARLLVRALTGAVRPMRAWCRIPVALPGEKTSTRVEPAASLYRSLPDVPGGVWEAALWVGYAWADEPRTAAAAVVIGDDPGAIQRACGSLAGRFVARRDDFRFCGPAGGLRWALDRAADAAAGGLAGPFFISDTGDNPTAGGSGDVATTLAALIADTRVTDGPGEAVWSALVDPAGVRAARAGGVGSSFDRTVGGCFGWPGQVPLRGVVDRVVSDVAGDVAVVRSGRLQVVLTTRRTPFHTPDDYRRAGIDLARTRLVVNKIGYLEPRLHEVAAGWVMALTDGPVDQRIDRLSYSRISRPLHPFDVVPDAWEPDVELFRPHASH